MSGDPPIHDPRHDEENFRVAAIPPGMEEVSEWTADDVVDRGGMLQSPDGTLWSISNVKFNGEVTAFRYVTITPEERHRWKLLQPKNDQAHGAPKEDE